MLVSQPLGSQRILLTAPPPHSDHLEANQTSPPKCSAWGGYEYSQPLDPAWAGGLSLLVLARRVRLKQVETARWVGLCLHGIQMGVLAGKRGHGAGNAEKEVGQRIVKRFAVSHE